MTDPIAQFNQKASRYEAFAFAPPKGSFERTWCDATLKHAPAWVSVDLRDGNQALIEPMNLEEKLRFFDLLVEVGFKEIEIGFPSASGIEFEFTRTLIEGDRIPNDVTIQVLTQARSHLIEKTFEALKGARRAVVHVYNSTSRVQRTKVYQKSVEEITALAQEGARLLRETAKKYPDTQWVFEYSPESFSQTEPHIAVDVCNAVCDIWRPDLGQEVVLNLPATVEASTPNVFADQVAYFCQHLKMRPHVLISLHTHNDRGCAVAASELGVLAGADRVEGTLLGNGERTGNMDILTMALNLHTQGIPCNLNLSRLGHIAHVVTQCNKLPSHPRHPYVGELVFTAFSGSHQDAIKKSLDYDAQSDSDIWDVAYLPIDPRDIGRDYQDVVRINSQSGKGGAAYILQAHYGFHLPRWMQIDFATNVQARAEETGKEVTGDEILQLFESIYLNDQVSTLGDYSIQSEGEAVVFTGIVILKNKTHTLKGQGNGALSAFIDALQKALDMPIYIQGYDEHALSKEAKSDNQTQVHAVAYIKLSIDTQSKVGVAVASSTVSAMLKATLNAVGCLA